MKKAYLFILLAIFFFSCSDEDNTSPGNMGDRDKIVEMQYTPTVTDEGKIYFIIEGKSLKIDWGDGTEIEKFENVSAEKVCSHTYDLLYRTYTIKITTEELYELTLNDETGVHQVSDLKVGYAPYLSYMAVLQVKTLTSLDLGGAVNLRALVTESCSNLNQLNVSNCLKLQSLNCSDNNLSALDLKNNTMLWNIYCSNNQLTQLDLSSMPDLESLNCMNNKLTELNLRNNLKITDLAISGNQLATVQLEHLNDLKYFYCDNNRFTTLNVNENPHLYVLHCGENQLATLNIAYNPQLVNLNCSNNQLTALQLTEDTDFRIVNVAGNMLDASALNRIFQKLPRDPKSSGLGEINIAANPGARSCNLAIATGKGWSFSKENR